jgi:tRNA A37 methylthiotransferase MiaB
MLNKERNNDSSLIVSGCLPAFASERILKVAPDAQLLTYAQMKQFEQIIDSTVSWDDVYYNHGHMIDEDTKNGSIVADEEDVDLKLARFFDNRNGNNNCERQYDLCTIRRYIWQDDDVYQIKVSYGCPGHCSYCATKLAIGEYKSIPKGIVLKQFKEGIEQGFRRFTLMGDEIGCYGSDFGENILTLLSEIYTINSNITVSIRYIHPDIFVKYFDGLKPYLMNGFIDFFCCAIQSGSPKILKSMNRNPNIEPFVKCMEQLKEAGCKANKHTQIIVGYPGEMHEDVWMTLQTLIRCDFDHININYFSKRRGTSAYELEETVTEEEKVYRGQVFRHILQLEKKAKMYDAIKNNFK